MYLCGMSRYCYDYPRPAVTTDCVVFVREVSAIRVLLIKRKHPPFQNCWALPGGFIQMEEDLAAAAARELEEETALKAHDLVQFRTYGHPLRDPRHRTITIVYTLEYQSIPSTMAGDDAAETAWFELDHLPEMAFDHAQILHDFTQALQFSNL